MNILCRSASCEGEAVDIAQAMENVGANVFSINTCSPDNYYTHTIWCKFSDEISGEIIDKEIFKLSD